MMLKFTEDRWLGNKWASIEIDPVDDTYFLPILTHLMATYGFPQPSVIDAIDGYIAEFNILNCDAILSLDTWSFSLACKQDAVRDTVLEALRALPDDYFET
jgi:hypothetical protein